MPGLVIWEAGTEYVLNAKRNKTFPIKIETKVNEHKI